MRLEDAPAANTAERGEEDREPEECDVCGAKGTFVLYDGEKICRVCQHAPDGGGPSDLTPPGDQWPDWWEHRRETEDYSGWYGHERIKFVGGFGAPYF